MPMAAVILIDTDAGSIVRNGTARWILFSLRKHLAAFVAVFSWAASCGVRRLAQLDPIRRRWAAGAPVAPALASAAASVCLQQCSGFITACRCSSIHVLARFAWLNSPRCRGCLEVVLRLLPVSAICHEVLSIFWHFLAASLEMYGCF